MLEKEVKQRRKISIKQIDQHIPSPFYISMTLIDVKPRINKQKGIMIHNNMSLSMSLITESVDHDDEANKVS